jgi:hypothetical protein
MSGMCSGKEAFDATRAKKVAKEMSVRRHIKIVPYKCPHCGHWFCFHAVYRQESKAEIKVTRELRKHAARFAYHKAECGRE